MPKTGRISNAEALQRLAQGWRLCEPMWGERVWRIYAPHGHPDVWMELYVTARQAESLRPYLDEGETTEIGECYHLRSQTGGARLQGSFRGSDVVVRFEQVEHDTQTGVAEWLATVNDGVEIGRIEKDTVWVGDGYVADSYSAVYYRPDGDEEEESWQVQNVWTHGRGISARSALALAKDFIRDCAARDRGALR